MPRLFCPTQARTVQRTSGCPVAEMSPRPDTHDSNSSTSVVVAAPSPQKPAERVVAGAMARDAAVAAVVVVAVENPYLAGLGKKTRGLKKKLEKIKKTESLSASGKVCTNATCSKRYRTKRSFAWWVSG